MVYILQFQTHKIATPTADLKRNQKKSNRFEIDPFVFQDWLDATSGQKEDPKDEAVSVIH
jgi:hypothetical protein